MTVRNVLRNIGLVGVLALGSGCGNDNNYRHYNFDGKIGEDYVIFESKVSGWGFIDDNVMTIRKPDGRVIECMDCDDEDLKLDYVKITKDGKTIKYTGNDEIGKPVLEEAQKLYDNYLSNIKTIKTSEGLNYLK